LGMISVGFDVTGQILITYFALLKYVIKKWEYYEAVHQLFVGFKKTCDSVRREVFYNNFIQLSIPMKLVRLIRMCPKTTAVFVRHVS